MLRRADAGVRSRLRLRVLRQPHQVAGRDQDAPRPAVPRPGAVGAGEGRRADAARRDRRAAGVRRGDQGHSHRRRVLVSRGRARASIVVTSTAPSEGKTVVSSNLAAALAQADQRTLIIDADMRRPRIHEVFGWLQEPGLSNVLVGTAPIGRCHSQDGGRRTCACCPPVTFRRIRRSCSARRASRSCSRELGASYDWIIIDAPPVMAVTDAALVGNIATGVVFVVGAEMTSRRHAAVAIEQLRRPRRSSSAPCSTAPTSSGTGTTTRRTTARTTSRRIRASRRPSSRPLATARLCPPFAVPPRDRPVESMPARPAHIGSRRRALGAAAAAREALGVPRAAATSWSGATSRCATSRRCSARPGRCSSRS